MGCVGEESSRVIRGWASALGVPPVAPTLFPCPGLPSSLPGPQPVRSEDKDLDVWWRKNMLILAAQRTSQLLCVQPAVQITGWGMEGGRWAPGVLFTAGSSSPDPSVNSARKGVASAPVSQA